MNNKDSYIEYIHEDLSINKMIDLVGNPMNTISVCYSWNLFDLLSYSDELDILNLNKIINRYNNVLPYQYLIANFNKLYYDEHIEEYKNLPLLIGTTICIPKNKVNIEIYSTLSNQIEKGIQYNAFLANNLKILLLDSDYKSIDKELNNKQSSSIKNIYPNITVWLWCRGLYNYKDGKEDLKGVIFNLTPFVINLSTSVNNQIGNFNIDLNNLICYFDSKEGWKLKNVRESDTNFISKFSLDILNNENLLRNSFYFKNIISENDLIFIRFETLKNEIKSDSIIKKGNLWFIKNRLSNQKDFIINNQDLPNQNYDMIGLVDSLIENTSYNDNSISIQGRDLRKLLIEDGCYFYPIEFIPGGIFANEVEDDYLERIDGKLSNLTQSAVKTISYTLKFIINNLSHIKICDENLFDYYGERKSKTFRLDLESRKKKNEERNKLNDLRKKILNDIHNSRKDDNLQENFDLDNNTFDLVKKFLLDKNKQNNLITIPDFSWDLGISKFPQNFDNYLFPQKLIKDTQGVVLISNSNTAAQTIPDSFINLLIKYYTIATEAYIENKQVLTIDYQLSDDSRDFKDFNKLKFLFQDYTGTGKQYYKGDYWEFQERLKNEIDLISFHWGDPLMKQFFESTVWMIEGDPFKLFKSDGTIDLKKGKNLYQACTVGDYGNQYLQAKNESLGLGFKEIWNRLIELMQIRIREITGKPLTETPNYNLVKFNKTVSYNYKRVDIYYKDLNNKQKDIIKSIWDYITEEKKYKDFQEKYEEKELKGIWKIIKFIIDDDVEKEGTQTQANIGNRRILDSSIGNENGNLISAIQKICQEPFVEFFGDTYGDQYYFIVRQPPFTEKAYKNLLDICKNIEIEEKDILSESLQFDTDNNYSWYKLKPQNMIIGLGEAIIKAVHFKEYSDIWGEKALEIVSNYLEYNSLIGDKSELNMYFIIKQNMYDLKYIVDINSYIPFTRKGTITINRDRRIKRGTIIKYKATGEVFYVDAVNQSYKLNNNLIDGTTTLQVSRGMVENYLDLYFHIIDTPIDNTLFYNQNLSYFNLIKSLYENWKVNKEVFNFLLTKKQFTNEKAPKINIFSDLSLGQKEIDKYINLSNYNE